MSFNADAYLRARQPWELRLGNRAYRAAWISVEEVTAFLVAFQGNNGTPPDAAGRLAATRTLLRRMFPWQLSYRWRDPVKQVMRLDDEARSAILADFFVWWKGQRSGNSTNGTGSLSKTPPPTPATSDPASV
ncbi:MAG TPA: hypothetical protein VGQ24_02625 [Gemmatimonadales bacterium]|jgi:hypothetical protein|nr:hypothetical protein [Gemmatimonadales bacterium]